MSYPKKPTYDRLEPPSEDKVYREGKRVMHDQFTKEIRKRAEVGILEDIIIDSEENNPRKIAKAISNHITEGLE